MAVCTKCGRHGIKCACLVEVMPNPNTLVCLERIKHSPLAKYSGLNGGVCDGCGAEYMQLHASDCERVTRYFISYDYDIGTLQGSRGWECKCGAKHREFHKSGCDRIRLLNYELVASSVSPCICGSKVGEYHSQDCEMEMCPACNTNPPTRGQTKPCKCVDTKELREDFIVFHPIKLQKRVTSERDCGSCGTYAGSSHNSSCKNEICPIHRQIAPDGCGGFTVSPRFKDCGCIPLKFIRAELKASISNDSTRQRWHFSGSAGRNQRRGGPWKP